MFLLQPKPQRGGRPQSACVNGKQLCSPSPVHRGNNFKYLKTHCILKNISFWKRQLTLVQNSMLAKGLPLCKYKEYQGDQGRVKASIVHGPISLLKESFSGACYVPGTVLGPGHTTEDKTDSCCSPGVYSTVQRHLLTSRILRHITNYSLK